MAWLEKKTGAYFFGLPSSSTSCALLPAVLRVLLPPFSAPPPRFFAPNAGLSLASVDAPLSPPRVLLPRHTPAPVPRPRPPLLPPRATVDMVATRPCSMRSCVLVTGGVGLAGACDGWGRGSSKRCVRLAQAESWSNATNGRVEETKKSQAFREQDLTWLQLKAAGMTSR